eukprot:SAG31_NODE_1473_length_8207_cov_2.716330_2_plen_590_part_00
MFKNSVSDATMAQLENKFTYIDTRGGLLSRSRSQVKSRDEEGKKVDIIRSVLSWDDLCWAYGWLAKERARDQVMKDDSQENRDNFERLHSTESGNIHTIVLEEEHWPNAQKMLLETASVLQDKDEIEEGITFRTFVILHCKTHQLVLPEAIAAEVNYSVFADPDSMQTAVEFMAQTDATQLHVYHGQGWFYTREDFEREEESQHDFSTFGWGQDVADEVVLESERDNPDLFSAYSRIVTLFIACSIFTVSWWLVPIITVVICNCELRLDIWRMTKLQRRNIPRPIVGEDSTNGWYVLLVNSLPLMNLIVAIFWCINTSGLETALKYLHNESACVPLFHESNGEFSSHGGLAWLYPGCGWDSYEYAKQNQWLHTASNVSWAEYITTTAGGDNAPGQYSMFGLNRQCFKNGTVYGQVKQPHPTESWVDTCPFAKVNEWYDENTLSWAQWTIRLFFIFMSEKVLRFISFWALALGSRGDNPRTIKELMRSSRLSHSHRFNLDSHAAMATSEQEAPLLVGEEKNSAPKSYYRHDFCRRGNKCDLNYEPLTSIIQVDQTLRSKMKVHSTFRCVEHCCRNDVTKPSRKFLVQTYM